MIKVQLPSYSIPQPQVSSLSLETGAQACLPLNLEISAVLPALCSSARGLLSWGGHVVSTICLGIKRKTAVVVSSFCKGPALGTLFLQFQTRQVFYAPLQGCF